MERCAMKVRALGDSGLMVSPIGLGTVKLGRNTGVKYPRPFDLPDDDAAAALLRRASELGVTLVDTAPAYGVSEERLGSLMRAHGWFGGRDRWTVATKAGETWDGERSTFDFSPEAIGASVERSVRRLGVEMVDLVLLHSDGRDAWIVRESGAVEALERMRERGLVRAIGVSTKSAAGTREAVRRLKGVGGPAAVMVTLNALDRSETEEITIAHEAGVGVLVKKALASGHLDVLRGHAPEELQRSGGDAVEAALRVALAPEGVGSVIVGTANPAHLAQAVRAAERIEGAQ